MLQLEYIETDCPYCGEAITAEVDPSAGSQSFIEDCPVCCRPIEYRAEISPAGETTLQARRDDET